MRETFQKISSGLRGPYSTQLSMKDAGTVPISLVVSSWSILSKDLFRTKYIVTYAFPAICHFHVLFYPIRQDDLYIIFSSQPTDFLCLA